MNESRIAFAIFLFGKIYTGKLPYKQFNSVPTTEMIIHFDKNEIHVHFCKHFVGIANRKSAKHRVFIFFFFFYNSLPSQQFSGIIVSVCVCQRVLVCLWVSVCTCGCGPKNIFKHDVFIYDNEQQYIIYRKFSFSVSSENRLYPQFLTDTHTHTRARHMQMKS